MRGGAAIVTDTTANQLSFYGSGVYNLTATQAPITYASTPTSITLTGPGTYLILANATLLYDGATFAAQHAVTLKLTRTNNTPADLANSSQVLENNIVTTQTGLFAQVAWFVLYTTTNSTDIIDMYGAMNVLPSAGTMDVDASSLVAHRLQQ